MMAITAVGALVTLSAGMSGLQASSSGMALFFGAVAFVGWIATVSYTHLTELEFTSLIDKMGLRGEAPTGQESGRPLPSEPERLDGAALAALDAGKVWTVGLLSLIHI